jgi:hypothetical protein
MMPMRKIWFLLLLFCSPAFAGPGQRNVVPEHLQAGKAIQALSLVMMHDVVSPPVAARYYAYSLLGAYQLVALANNKMPAPEKFIQNYPAVNGLSIVPSQYDHRIAAYYCLLETGKQMLPSGYLLQAEQDKFLQHLKSKKISKALIGQSVAAATEMTAKVLDFAKADNYNKLSALLRYSPFQQAGSWYPTPPAYMEAVEPHWRTIKPLLMDSCNQYPSLPPVVYSQDPASPFYALAKEVHEVTSVLDAGQLAIAAFWDCNPFAVTTSGHMAIGFKKISPGGHWMNIASIAAKKANLDFDKTVLVLSLEAFTLMDAFIACWDEKFKSNRIRPETYINRYLDKKWMPLLQTPPFPEYTSGHAVISSASAEVLTYFLGDHFAYTDDSEVIFEIAPRSFNSFREAAAEASISRLYGGIHFRDAVENGNKQGKEIGAGIVSKMKAAGIRPVFMP